MPALNIVPLRPDSVHSLQIELFKGPVKAFVCLGNFLFGALHGSMSGFWGDKDEDHESLPALILHTMVLPRGGKGHLTGTQFSFI